MSGKPIVALESTIIAHGMPYPRNLEVAHALERIVREGGAVPATIAVMDGKIRVGLDEAALERLARGEDVAKVSRRDLAMVLTTGGVGATTVAATMICAAMAGIKIFATGGIGGVHTDGQDTLDISADLTELGRTNVAVVCAGAKSILDIGRTLEVLETLGVPVIGYRCDAFPAFYVADSGFPVPARLDSPEAIARMLVTKWALGITGGAVIANPIAADAALDAAILDDALTAAHAVADAHGIAGKALTPFLLEAIRRETGGQSLEANIALVMSNAALAAEIAVAMPREELAQI